MDEPSPSSSPAPSACPANSGRLGNAIIRLDQSTLAVQTEQFAMSWQLDRFGLTWHSMRRQGAGGPIFETPLHATQPWHLPELIVPGAEPRLVDVRCAVVRGDRWISGELQIDAAAT